MSNLFTSKQEHDSDPAVLFFDADIKGMKPDVIKDKIQAIESGTVIEVGESNESSPELEKMGKHYYLINKIYEISNKYLKLKDDWLFGIIGKGIQKQIVSQGHNSTFSGMATVLLNGFAPHDITGEDIRFGRRVHAAFQRFFKKSTPKNYVSTTSSGRIECDGDAVKRAVDLSRPIIDKYRSHDGKKGNLTPFLHDNISIKRLEEEINGCLTLTQEKYGELFSKVPQEFKPVIKEYLKEKESKFYAAINSLIQEEVAPLMQSKNSNSAQVTMKIDDKTGLVSLEQS
jgi:hypothetical protein